VAIWGALVQRVFDRLYAVDACRSDRMSEVRMPQPRQCFWEWKFDYGMKLRQQDFTDNAIGMKDNDRADAQQILLVTLLARHVPHLADKTFSVEKQNPFCTETDPRIAEGLGQNRRPWEKDERKRD
jgi:hypothetical protein